MGEEYCIPQHVEGKVGTEPESLHGLKSGDYVEFYIQNTAGDALYLSMDGKQHYKKISAGASIRLRGTARHPIRIKVEDWYVKGEVADTTYEVVVLVVEKDSLGVKVVG